PEGLAEIHPALPEIFENTVLNPLDDVDPCDVAFQFHILASATPLSRDEFIAQQTDEALRLRDAIIADPAAPQALVVLAADPSIGTDAYLAALEQAGLLRPEDQAPAVHRDPLVVSFLAALASGILAGPAGSEIIGDGSLVDFFAQLRQWYGHDPNLIG